MFLTLYFLILVFSTPFIVIFWVIVAPSLPSLVLSHPLFMSTTFIHPPSRRHGRSRVSVVSVCRVGPSGRPGLRILLGWFRRCRFLPATHSILLSLQFTPSLVMAVCLLTADLLSADPQYTRVPITLALWGLVATRSRPLQIKSFRAINSHKSAITWGVFIVV